MTGFAGLHPAILLPPAMERRLAHTQRLQHLPQRLAGIEQPIRLLKLLHDLPGTVTNALGLTSDSPWPSGTVETLTKTGSSFAGQATDQNVRLSVPT